MNKFKYNGGLTRLLAFLGLLVTCNYTYSQKTYRRHFIIAYDISTPFIISEKSCSAFREALTDLFLNDPVSRFNESYQDNLSVEKKNGVKFFEINKDEISFFHFNVALSEMDNLRWAARNYDEKGIVSAFNKAFLKNKNLNWSDFVSQGKPNVIQYINSLFNCPVTPPTFNGGVSMSNFVFPLVLNQIDTTKYAEEYILIILSDFLTGSMFGNTKDLNRVKDIYGVGLSKNSPVSYIKNEIDYMASQYYKIDFFQYSFLPLVSSNPIGILSFKIKPKVGVLTPEDVALFVDGDLALDQRGYQSSDFKMSETKIKFTHNKNLVPTELSLIISMPFGNSERVLFQDVIADRDILDEWKSKYTSDNDLMMFDSNKLTYYIPALKLTLDSVVNRRDFKSLNFKFEFKTKYEIANTQPLNFIYYTDRAMPIESIDYSTKATIIIMYYILPLVAILALILYVVYYSKPRSLALQLIGYLDSFEKTDYKTTGKIVTPYKAWNIQPPIDHLFINGELEFKSKGFLFNWNPNIYLQLGDVVVPDGFEMFLKYNTEDIKEFASGKVMPIRKGKKNKFNFVAGIRQNDITKQLGEPQLVKFKINAAIKESNLFIKSDLLESINYNFHIGTDLGDVWVGFDPGTTGSCVSVGTETENIILIEDVNKNKIIPSVLVFKKTENFHRNGIEIPEIIYKHGTIAQTLYTGKNDYQGFQSIKKLIGFDDIYKILFDNKNTLELRGKDLAGLLVKGLFNDAYAYFNRPEISTEDYKRNGSFNPLRAVVAIPNNFTIRKIQDIINCIGDLNRFKEIRYVYEAEAVLFYYLSNFRQLSKGEDLLDEEAILVFDMGGATINATVVTSTKMLENERLKYEIDILGKIGYGIGGDTIDYCISKFILSFKDEFAELGSINILKNRIELAKLAFAIKVDIIANYYQSENDFLITAFKLRGYIREFLNITLTKSAEEFEETTMYSFFRKESGKFKLFEHSLFIKTIYNNVRDAVNEVLQLSETTQIDKVIFSGRSTAFPMIKETVEKQLKAKVGEIIKIALNLEDSKMAVAKGACWYGINKNSVKLNNLKTNASFGFKRTMSADRTDVKFYELVEMGCTFDTRNDGIDSFEGSESIRADFAFDGDKINFFQIMGKDADRILSEGQKHKFSKIANIKIDQMTSKVAMKVNENDEVECVAKLESNRIIREIGIVTDQEIDEANEEHYTWILK